MGHCSLSEAPCREQMSIPLERRTAARARKKRSDITEDLVQERTRARERALAIGGGGVLGAREDPSMHLRVRWELSRAAAAATTQPPAGNVSLPRHDSRRPTRSMSPAEGPTRHRGEGAAVRHESQARGERTISQSQQPYANPKANARATAIVYPSQPSKGPATFQEMGYHSQKLDEKECIIM